MKSPVFTGVCTALVTPFLDGKINYPMLEQLVHRQIEAGIEAVVVCGTTGEAATLTDSEKLEIFRRTKEYAGGKCKVIAGTGSNSTAHAVLMSKAAEDCGVDALLVVAPYYNKGTAAGLIQHYTLIASSVDLPVILYNVPSRTGIDLPVNVYRELSQIPNIAGVKEANSDMTRLIEAKAACPADFRFWCGTDELTVPMIAMGSAGVISVLSNLWPELTQTMARAALDGDFDTAAALQLQLFPAIRALFAQVNPVPVKAAMKLLGFDCGGCRLPLTDPDQKTLETLSRIFCKN